MKKIAFLSHLDLNLYLFRLPIMIKLVEEGYKVYAICPRGEKFNQFEQYGITALEYKIVRKSLNPLTEVKTIKNIYNVIQPLNLDILQNFTAKPNIYGSIAGYFAKVPMIVNAITGLGSFYISESRKAKIVKFIIEILYKYINKKASFIIFQNNDDKNYFIDNNLVHKRKAILIKSSGIDTDIYQHTIYQKTQSPLIVLMIARAIWHKGIKEYYAAADILKNENVQFILIGATDEGNLSCADEKFLTSGNVKWLGHRDDIKHQIDLCDIFVLPSYREGVPRTLLEASSMSKPIVTTDSIGCREVVIDGYNGFLVPVKDEKVLASQIKELIKNQDLREIMGKNGRIRALEEFDIEIIAKKYLEVYETII